MRLLRKTANVPWGQMGISGSILVGLHNSASDIDPVVYGSKNCSRVYSALNTLIKETGGLVRPYSTKDLKRLFYSRSQETVASFKDFVRTEMRKILQGKFMDSDYFIRFVKNWEEIDEKYGWVRYFPEGYAKIKARVIDNSEMIYTPCTYKIDNVELLQGKNVEPIEEIVSFRGRFCEQAKIGETVVAQGKVERMDEDGSIKKYRLLLGNKVSDNMVLAD
jgi:predicted nucleotidyltransferase